MPQPVRRRVVLPVLLVALAAALVPPKVRAAEALIAVAANFAATAEALKPAFHDATGHDVTVTTGSTGKLYAQIRKGAPFDAMLSADTATPARLVAADAAEGGSVFTYAVGRLVLWSAAPGRVGADGRAALTDPALRFVAIANPELAPYGAAGREALRSMGLWAQLQDRIVMGQNIGQAHAMVATGAAELGLVALSAVRGPDGAAPGSAWEVPQELYSPIRQDAVLLDHGAGNAAARAFLDFLRTPRAADIIRAYGYGVE